MKSTNKKKTKRGSILVTLLFLICVLALLVATVANDSLQTLKTVSQSGRDTQAKYAAYAGMELVMNKLRTQDRYIGDPISAPNHGRKAGTLSELNKVTYEVLIWNNMRDEDATGPPADPIVATGGVNVQPDTVYMISTGQDTVRAEEVIMTSMAGTARRVRPVFEDAAYARSKMILLGDTLVDAWDSGGGWTDYVAGDFPGDPPSTGSGSSAGGNGGHGGGDWGPTVQDHKATLGTDSKSDRTLRMLGDSRLNGHYRIGPGVTAEGAFSDDSGTTSTTSTGSRTTGGDTTTAFGVSTAVDPVHQIAGVEGGTPGVLGDTEYFKLDDKSTEMPRFTAPYDADDLESPPVLNNPPTSYQVPGQGPGNPPPVTVNVPPAAVDVPPGGYQSINVPDNQTLRLSPGVYYFHEEMRVEGKLEISGNDPVIIFIGKKAVFDDAEINKEGRTSSLQLCFTDEEKDPAKLDELVESLLPDFELPATASASTTTDPIGGRMTTSTTSAAATLTLEEYVRRIIAPLADATDPASQEGASVLEMNGGELHGSISGKNLVVKGHGGEIFGGVMANVFRAQSTDIHQDLALKGSNLMNAGGWALEGVHQLR